MKKVTIPTNEGIDWSKPQWVQYIHDKTCLILTTGDEKGDLFSGTCMPHEGRPRGEYRNDWVKCNFTILTFDIPFTISNSSE